MAVLDAHVPCLVLPVRTIGYSSAGDRASLVMPQVACAMPSVNTRGLEAHHGALYRPHSVQQGQVILLIRSWLREIEK